MLAQADHNNIDALSKQGSKQNGELDGAFPANLKFSGEACPRTKNFKIIIQSSFI